MPFVDKLREAVIGKPHNPLHPDTRHNIALVAFLAWIGLGADGLSSACYGPEEAFVALGQHTHFGLYLAAATFLTVFIIALAYNQVIELFPSGGGGYKVATQLLGPRAGLVSGTASYGPGRQGSAGGPQDRRDRAQARLQPRPLFRH